MLSRILPIFALVLVAGRASAAPPTPTPAAPSAATDDPSVQQARESFKEGLELAKNAQWSEALRAFEKSSKLRQHAVTTFNIGACERALGHYMQARATIKQSMDESAAHKGDLPENLASEARAYLTEIDGLVVHLDTTVDPADALVAVDGRPLVVSGATDVPTLVAGIAEPGTGAQLPAAHVMIEMDPGTHLFALSRKGFADVVLNKTFAPGTKATLALAAQQVPATIRITSNQAGAAVDFNGVDVGITPVDLTRPGGTYTVLVRHDGFDPYKTSVEAAPGATLSLNAELSPGHTPITQRWWFWTGAAAVVAGAVVTTFLVTRPAAQRPPVETGGLNWALMTP
jgi:hypothetical protein